MRIARLAGLVVLAGLLVVPSASAQYPPTVGNGRVSRSDVKQCQCTQFSGDGFAPGTGVTITDNGTFVTFVTVNRSGRFTVKVCFDERSRQGRHVLEGSGGGHVVRAVVQVSGSVCFKQGDEVHDGQGQAPPPDDVAGGGSGGLPHTGADLARALLLGFALVAGGSAVVFATRRRRAAVAR